MQTKLHSDNRRIENLDDGKNRLQPQLLSHRTQAFDIAGGARLQDFIATTHVGGHHVTKVAQQLASQLPGINAAGNALVNQIQSRLRIVGGHRGPDFRDTTDVRCPQQLVDFVDRNIVAAEREKLLQQRLAISHRTVGSSSQQLECFVGGLYAFAFRDLAQAVGDLVGLNGTEVVSLTARQNCDRNLLRIGGAENEFDMRRGLFQRFQQRVERRRGQHVNFVDNVNLESAAAWANGSVGPQLTNLVDTAVTGTVNFQHVNVFTDGYRFANLAFVARFGGRPRFAIQALGENSSAGSLSDSAGTGEQVSMSDAVGFDRVGKRLGNVALANQIRKGLRAIPEGNDLVFASGAGSCGIF